MNNEHTLKHCCGSCGVLPITRPEARQMRSTGLCDECEGEARLLGWKPLDGLLSALQLLKDKGVMKNIAEKRNHVRELFSS